MLPEHPTDAAHASAGTWLLKIGLAALAIAFVMPGHYHPWTAAHQELAATIAVLACGASALVALRSSPWPVPPPAVVAVLLAIVPAAQWAGGLVIFGSDALLAALYLCCFAVATVVGAVLYRVHGAKLLAWLFGTLVAAGVVSVAIGLAQWAQVAPNSLIDPIAPDGRIPANLLQPNQLASLLGLGVAGLAWFFERRRLPAVIVALGLAWLGFGLVMTQSRSAWLFTALMVLLWAAFRRSLRLRTPAAVLGAVAVTFVLATLTWPALNQSVAAPVEVASLPERLRPGMRLVHWASMMDALARAPVFGFGWMQIPVAQYQVAASHPPTGEWLTSSHNLVLDLLVWNGLPIGLLLVGWLVWWIVSRLRSCTQVDTWAAIAAILVLASHAMVEHPLHFAYFLVPAGLLAGIVEASSGRTMMPRATIGRKVFATALVALTCVVTAVAHEYRLVEQATQRTILKEDGVVLRGAEPAAPTVWLLDGPREYVRLWLTEPRPGMTSAEVDWMRRVSQRYPVPAGLFRSALASGLAGRAAEAEQALIVLCRTTPEQDCTRGRAAWQSLAVNHPALGRVKYPERDRP
jgi:Virulence factor membrane-bound polymerase, C-terminal/O-Antigen ligase